ncbi:RlmI/RlmK family 23S rRNA methyltransferase [Tetragenococcus osmophilus]|uniref:RlmI/RlmK family 23S rRNA methyltransferase n=1 Tax=Tetragenococcus osmophilus TaxID=526944 RepID=A0AA38CVL4_9ENTE|nr:class I SAM-dependent rRNA methyltransferase [Tetragenococcus osmophilus]AYW48249.1 RlmI/RlmK family 23S rRNA methyltransferase [Tetragenococcus osmophilus]GMA54037.1 SAM-dependent methyltransferase [Alicyclobacillus contaminans]GMA72068.1 SAM-dependent methyltransferase [Tetragenococcus osmophilus]
MEIKVTQQAAKRIRRGYPLLQKQDLLDRIKENQWLDFVDKQGNLVAKGYLGVQNNGVGWCLTTKDRPLDHAFFVELFFKARQRRQECYQEKQTDAFRLLNGAGDHLGGVTIDKYADFAVVSWYNETLYNKQDEIMAAFKEVFPEIKGIYEKLRFHTEQTQSRLLWGMSAPEPLYIKENNINYAVYLNEGLMTGIFLDQREVRKLFAEGFAQGQDVLNMFSYTGAFSVAAAAGGANTTINVDLAKRSLKKTQEQFLANQIPLSSQTIHVMDTFAYFKYAQKKQLTFDCIILDPPSFARNKKKVFRVAKDYGELIESSVAILKDQGVIMASSNAANVTSKKFQNMIEKALQNENVGYKLIKKFRLPQDFVVDAAYPAGDYLKVYFYQIKKD